MKYNDKKKVMKVIAIVVGIAMLLSTLAATIMLMI